MDIDQQLKKLEKEDLLTRWQLHRQWCLELAAKLGAETPREAKEYAEQISAYVLHGPQKDNDRVDLST